MRTRLTMDFHSNVLGMVLGTKTPQDDFIMSFTASTENVMSYFSELTIVPLTECSKEFGEELGKELATMNKEVTNQKSYSFRIKNDKEEVAFSVEIINPFS